MTIGGAMNTKLALLVVLMALGLLFSWSVKDDLTALQEKLKQPDYQAYTKEAKE